MTQQDYEATGINHFVKLEDLLRTRCEMMQTLCDIVDNSKNNKVTAYDALNAARILFDKAVLDEIQKILDSHKAVGLLEKPTDNKSPKLEMTDYQQGLGKSFQDALVDCTTYVLPQLKRNGIERYYLMAINLRDIGEKLLDDWWSHFGDKDYD